MKMTLYGLILFLTAGITVARELLMRVGFNTNFLLIALIALVVTGLLMYQNLLFVVLIIFMTAALYLPEEFLQQIYIDQDIILGSLIALIVLPTVYQAITR